MSEHKDAVQQQLFEARMGELRSVQKALHDEKDTLFTLEERLRSMVESRVVEAKEKLARRPPQTPRPGLFAGHRSLTPWGSSR